MKCVVLLYNWSIIFYGFGECMYVCGKFILHPVSKDVVELFAFFKLYKVYPSFIIGETKNLFALEHVANYVYC